MRTVRQMASGLAYAGVSLLLVLGSLALSLAQTRTAPPASPAATTATAIARTTPSPQVLPSSTSVVATNQTAAPTRTETPEVTVASATSTPPRTAAAATSRPAQTSTVACGPYTGWARSYVVQPGDTLYRIATLHGIDVEILKRANCKTGTLIYAGEKLWVPFTLPEPTALTVIPTFPTPTDEVTPTSSPTPTSTMAS